MESFENKLYPRVIEKMLHEADKIGIGPTAKRILKEEKIEPIYFSENENPETLNKNRSLLNTEAGLIIANHPGYSETFIILSTLTRDDIKLIVSEENYKKFSDVLGGDRIIKATKDSSEAGSFLRSIREHVRGGGIVLLYPTGGRDRIDREDQSFVFGKGLSVILRRCMEPSDMVYSFYVDPEGFRPLVDEKVSRHMGAASAITLNPTLNVNQLKTPVEVEVRERYSTAQEWQEVIKNADTSREEALANHFIEQMIK